LRKLQKDGTKTSTTDNQQRFSSSSTEAVKTAERSGGSGRVFSEHKETSSSSHGAGIARNATLLDPSGRQQQQQQKWQRGSRAASNTLQQRLAELSQSFATSTDTQSAAAANTDLAALLSAISAAVNRPTQ